jgi:hypothetical protein
LFIFLLGTVLALRLVAAVRPALASLANTTSVLSAKGLKWAGRISTLVAIAASLTFLGTDDNGPGGRISLKLRDARKDYEYLQNALTDRADRLLRQSLIAKAWDERPRPLRAQMDLSALFQQERDKYEEMRRRAKDSYQIEPRYVEKFPLSLDIPDHRPDAGTSSPTEPAPSWTPTDLREAAADAEVMKASEPVKGLDEGSEAADDIARRTFEKLLPADRLFEHSPLLSLLSSSYPAFGELVDAIVSSISEEFYGAMRDSIVRSVLEMRSIQRSLSLAHAIDSQVASRISNLHLDLSRFSDSWANVSEARIAGYREEIDPAIRRLESAAADKLHGQTPETERSIRARARLLGEVGAAIHSPDLRERAVALQDFAGELATLEMEWPALEEPGVLLKSRLAAISMKIEGRGLSKSQIAAILPAEWASPMEAIDAIGSFCDERIIEAVAASSSSEAESAKLKQVMRDRYDAYYGDWRTQVAERAKAQQDRELDDALRKSAEEIRTRGTIEDFQRHSDEYRERSEGPRMRLRF